MKPTKEAWYCISGALDGEVQDVLEQLVSKGEFKERDYYFWNNHQHAAAFDIIVNRLLRQHRRWASKAAKRFSASVSTVPGVFVDNGSATSGADHSATTATGAGPANTDTKYTSTASARAATSTAFTCTEAAEAINIYRGTSCLYITSMVGTAQNPPGSHTQFAAKFNTGGGRCCGLFGRISFDLVRYSQNCTRPDTLRNLGFVFKRHHQSLFALRSLRRCIREDQKIAANWPCSDLCQSLQRADAVSAWHGSTHAKAHVLEWAKTIRARGGRNAAACRSSSCTGAGYQGGQYPVPESTQAL